MADADILKDLRERVLDESESLDGLLRKSLALGTVTGSDELRAWANNELKGYADTAAIPEYRQLPAPLFVDSTSGPMSTTGEQISRGQVLSDLQRYVPESLYLRHPIKELMHMASLEKSTRMAPDTFSSVAALWTQQLQQENMFQKIDALYYKVLPSTFGGVVDTVRTTLVEMVFDMTKDVPLDKLPSQARVDQVVQVHVGSTKYEVNISGSNSGNIGQGSNFSQVQNSSLPTELVDLLERLRAGLTEIENLTREPKPSRQ